MKGIPLQMMPFNFGEFSPRGSQVFDQLYRENRPVNLNSLRTGGPGGAYFFPAGRGPTLPLRRDPPFVLEHSSSPAFYVVVSPTYKSGRYLKKGYWSFVVNPSLVRRLPPAPSLFTLMHRLPPRCALERTSSEFA